MIFRVLDIPFGIGISPEKLREQLREYAATRSIEANSAIIAEHASLDAKSNSLLQHISIMIAALSVSYATNPPAAVKAVVIINIFLYLIVVLFTLRVITNVNFTNDSDLSLKLARELKLRERYYTAAHLIATILTAFLVLTVIVAGIYYRNRLL